MLWGRCTAHKNEDFSGFFRKQFNPDDCRATKQAEPPLLLQPGEDISIGQVLLLQPWWPCGSPVTGSPQFLCQGTVVLTVVPRMEEMV